MGTLPTEIWLLITAYLSSEDVNRLIGVNRQLTNITLNLRYHVAVAAPCLMRRYLQGSYGFIHFSASLPQVLHRVYELVFKDDPPIVVDNPIAVHCIPVHRLAPLKITFSRDHRCLQKYFKQLLLRVVHMENVHAITFSFNTTSRCAARDYMPQPHIRLKMAIFCALATAQPSQITHLSLQTNLNTIIPYWPNEIIFPNLTELWIKVHSHKTNDTPIFNFIHSLINTHSASLQELRLTHSPYIKLNDVLEGIGRLPQLRRFGLCWFLEDTTAERQAVSKFMQDHATQIVELRLRVVPWRYDSTPNNIDDMIIASSSQNTVTVLNDYFDFTFPSLRHFSLYFQNALPGQVATVHRFLRRHDQLLSLVLLPADIYDRSILPLKVTVHFKLANGPFISFSLLQDLTIYSNMFDILLLSFVSSSLPFLQYLRIEGLLSLLIPRTATGFENIERSLHSWKLSDMMLQGETRRWKFDDKYQLTCLFAGVKRICGQAPLTWAKGEEDISDSLTPSRARIAPDYHDKND